MREIRPSGSEGGVGLIPHPYPYPPVGNRRGSVRMCPVIRAYNISPVKTL